MARVAYYYRRLITAVLTPAASEGGDILGGATATSTLQLQDGTDLLLQDGTPILLQ